MTPEQSTCLVAMIQAAYPHKPMADSSVRLYAAALVDLEFDAAQEAVMRCIKTSRWLPTVAEIRESVVDDRLQLPSPEEAWGVVRAAIGSVGAYRIPSFDVDEINRTVAALGWRDICLDENVPSTRARFIDTYRGLRAKRMAQAVKGAVPLPTARSGHELPPASGEGAVVSAEALALVNRFAGQMRRAR